MNPRSRRLAKSSPRYVAYDIKIRDISRFPLQTGRLLTFPNVSLARHFIEHIYSYLSERVVVRTISKFQVARPSASKHNPLLPTPRPHSLTHPQIFQHRVEPFHLQDSSKPGHRKILALFLVDPHESIISTANIPCQQKEWWDELVQGIGPLGGVPKEINQQILRVILSSHSPSLSCQTEYLMKLMSV